MKTGKLEVFISMTLMSALTNKNDGQFPAKIKQSSWGSCTYANRLPLTKSQVIQQLFSTIYRFKVITEFINKSLIL